MKKKNWIISLGIIVSCAGILLFPIGKFMPKIDTSYYPNIVHTNSNIFLLIAILFVASGIAIVTFSYIKPHRESTIWQGLFWASLLMLMVFLLRKDLWTLINTISAFIK